MKFYFTRGDKKPKYMVSIYAWNVQDQVFYKYYRDAVNCFNKQVAKKRDGWCCISLYDLRTDEKKMFFKYEAEEDKA